jgi:hypothetical protein
MPQLYRASVPEYENIREVINPQYRNLSSEQIESLLERYGMDAEAMEGFFNDLGNFAKSVAPTVLPIAGAAVGTLIGGPAGGAVGGMLGRVAGSAIASQPGPGAGGPPAAVHAPAPPALPAASKLLQTITRPETIQALLAMLMGGLGRSNVQVGSTSVPVTAITNLLGVLAGKAEAEYNAARSAGGEALPEYMKDYAGEAIADPAVRENRAEVLYELFESTPVEQESEAGEAYQFEGEMEATDSEYDAMDLAELYGDSANW